MYNVRKKGIGIGIDDFKSVIEKNLYYVDKTLLIKEVIDDKSQVKLITRSRRFGKTLNMSTLRYFFDNLKKEENRELFSGLNIENVDNGKYMEYQGEYPVIYFSLKGLSIESAEDMKNSIKFFILNIISNYEFILDNLDGIDKELYKNIIIQNQVSPLILKFLIRILSEYYNKKVILLIDEYDSPLINAYSGGFYDDVISFFKIFFSESLKSNEYLEMAVMTGITRIAKESIFSGLNNLMVYSVLSDGYKEYFGFTENEVIDILNYYDLGDELGEVREYYDGYRFGDIAFEGEKNKVIDMYNPWSITNYAKIGNLKEYWINTSSDSIIFNVAKGDFARFLDASVPLMKGEEITAYIDDYIALQNLNSIDDIWTLLLNSGYLTAVSVENITLNRYKLKLPNEEVKKYFSIFVECVNNIKFNLWQKRRYNKVII